MQFIKNKPVGYNINLLAEMPQEGNMISKFELFKEQLLETWAVTSVNEASRSMTDAGNWFYGFEWPGMQKRVKRLFSTGWKHSMIL